MSAEPGKDAETETKQRPWLERARGDGGPLCQNCLRPEGISVEIGPELGSQRDPYREAVLLCPDCVEALLNGDCDLFRIRFARERTVTRD